MAIDVSSETLISFQEAPKHIPGTPHISSLHRWRLRGVRGRRLETVICGGRRFTSKQAIERFMLADEGGETDASDRKRRADRAGKELDSLGI